MLNCYLENRLENLEECYQYFSKLPDQITKNLKPESEEIELFCSMKSFITEELNIERYSRVILEKCKLQGIRFDWRVFCATTYGINNMIKHKKLQSEIIKCRINMLEQHIEPK